MSTNEHVILRLVVIEMKDLHVEGNLCCCTPQSMSSEKRKAPDDWVQVRVLDDKDSRGVYLASFSGVQPPDSLTFREFKRKRTAEGVKDVIVQGETERIEFEGRSVAEEEGDNCQYVVGILNREMGSVKLIPAPMIHMQRSIKALKSKAARAAPETPSRVSVLGDCVNGSYMINE